MKTKIFVLSACGILGGWFAAAGRTLVDQLVDCGGVKIETFGSTLAPEERYVVGCASDPAARKALKKEQLEWIARRDLDAAQAIEQAEKGKAADPGAAQSKTLLESTQKRAAELKARLAGL